MFYIFHIVKKSHEKTKANKELILLIIIPLCCVGALLSRKTKETHQLAECVLIHS